MAEDTDSASTRVWAAVESLKKAGKSLDGPLSLVGGTDDGWVTIGSGPTRIATVAACLRQAESPVCIAVLVESANGSL